MREAAPPPKVPQQPSPTMSGKDEGRIGGGRSSRAEQDDERRNRLQRYSRSRRAAVSSEPVTAKSLNDWCPPSFPKSTEERERIAQMISRSLDVLFGHLGPENLNKVVNAMFRREVPEGTVLIRQGDLGDNFYLVQSGVFDIFVSRPGQPSPERVLTATAGMSFGELALMYDSPRAATCIATVDSVVWALDRSTFRMLLVTEENRRKRRYEALLGKIPIFKCLTKLELGQLSDMLTPKTYQEGDCVIRQGDRGDRFYIVETGELVCKIRNEDGIEVEAHSIYRSGTYFGELALIAQYGTRKASVYVINGPATLLWIGKAKFDRVLGPLIELFRRNAESYPTLTQLMTTSRRRGQQKSGAL